jgi:Glycosyltransferase family 87
MRCARRPLCSPRLPAALCVAVAAVSAVLAAYDVWLVGSIVVAQFRGPAEGTDFLNLYAGGRLFLSDPPNTYSFDAQLALQRSLTGRESPLVPFYLPPYAALLVSWLGWLAYPVAYLVWLVLGMCCFVVASAWLAPVWTRWYAVLWSGIAMLFLPALLGLAQGQTSALMLVCAAAFVRGVLARGSLRAGLGLIGLALKPQLAPLLACALLAARCWRGLVTTALLVGVLTGAALVRLGGEGSAAYAAASRQKLIETFTADPLFLLGPTLLHASHWYLGVNATAHVVAACVVIVVLSACIYVWRRGPAQDDLVLVQLALLPVAAIIVAPYALVYELTIWLVSFWLLWRYTVARPGARAALLWLTAAIWVAGDVGVGLPRAGGADAAALLGVCAVGLMVWLYHTHAAHGSATLALNSIGRPRGGASS